VVFRPTPLKNDGVKVSWDDEIPNIWKIKNVPNHQPVTVCYGKSPSLVGKSTINGDFFNSKLLNYPRVVDWSMLDPFRNVR